MEKGFVIVCQSRLVLKETVPSQTEPTELIRDDRIHMTDKDPTLLDLLTEGLLHEDRFVRKFCLQYWEKRTDRGSAQASRIIDALKAHGMQAFEYPFQAYEIPLDRSAFEHLVETLHEMPCFDDTDMEHLGRWLQWCLSVETELLPDLEAFLKSDQAQAFEGNGFVTTSELLESVKSMRKHEGLDAEACYAGIEKELADIESADEFPHETVAQIISLLDHLIKVETPERMAKFARSWLALTPTIDLEAEASDNADWTDDFRFGFGVYLAGELRLTSSVDRIIDGVAKTDWDWLNETSVEALVKMPPREATARLRARWWSLPEYGRLYFSAIFENTHLREHRDFYLENMARLEEHDFEVVPHRMACALALLGDSDSINEAAEYWMENADDPEAFGVAETLYAIHRLKGEAPPILEPIREAMIEEETRHAAARERMAKLNEMWARKQRLEQINLPVVRKTPKVGRNDPCPCGSGKKHKKCCL